MSDDLNIKTDLLAASLTVSTATLTTVLLKRGLRNVYIRNTHQVAGERKRIAGSAFTMRYVPTREDLATPESWSSPTSTRHAIEAMPDGCICVAGAEGTSDAGMFGDILCTRMKVRGVAGLVTDGPMRDMDGVRGTGLDVWASGAVAPPSIATLTFVGWQEPIGCGGVAVMPGDLIVADADGAVVVPRSIIEPVIVEALEQEKLEAWIVERIADGEELPGLYPISAENRARYEADDND